MPELFGKGLSKLEADAILHEPMARYFIPVDAYEHSKRTWFWVYRLGFAGCYCVTVDGEVEYLNSISITEVECGVMDGRFVETLRPPRGAC